MESGGGDAPDESGGQRRVEPHEVGSADPQMVGPTGWMA